MDTKLNLPMTYRERLQPWIVIRLLPNMQRVIVRRFRTESDADGYAKALRRLMPDSKFAVVFAPQDNEGLHQKQIVTEERRVIDC